MNQQVNKILKIVPFLFLLVGLWMLSFEQRPESPLSSETQGEVQLPRSFCQQDSLPPSKWWKFRAKIMVEQQLKTNGIADPRLLKVMATTPRHLFVDTPYQKYAYSNSPLPIGAGQTIAQPYIVAMMTELLNLSGDEKVLQVGTGSGYQTAILAQLADQVYAIEPVQSLAEKARQHLHQLGYENTQVKWRKAEQGWNKHAPYDAVIVTASLGETPKQLTNQLASGGRMVLPIGKGFYQELMVVTKKKDGAIRVKKITNVRFVQMAQP